MKVAIFSSHKFELPYLERAFGTDHEVVYIEKELSEETVNLAESCNAVALFTSDKADAAVLKKLATLGIKGIALRSAGFDHVDLKEAKQLNIKVTNVPAYSPHSVAEHAVTLLMALNRKLNLSQELMRSNDFRLDELTGFDLHGKTVGIIGLGRIGEVFANIMNGFGCKLLCYDPNPSEDLDKDLNIKFVEFDELCAQSDVISIHCPLNTSTKYLFNKNAFALMKRGVFIINTARGAIINTTDLLDFLDSGIIGAAGLDVYEFEKGLFFHDHSDEMMFDKTFEKLRSYKNVLITGHQAFLTETALKSIADTTAYNVTCFEKGCDCENELGE